MKRQADWRGRIMRRRRFGHGRGWFGRLEWGWYYYRTNSLGDTLEKWWDWEKP